MSTHSLKSSVCLNCSTPLDESHNYCHHCGQENHDLHIPVKHLFLELVEGVLHFDAKFFQTAKLLLFKPGVLTEEFNAGKRMKFVPPVRMYIFISFIFFLLLSMFAGKQSETGGEHGTTADGNDSAAVIMGTAMRTFRENARTPHPAGEKPVAAISGSPAAGIGIDLDTLKGSDSASVAYINNKVKALQTDHFHGFFSRMFRSMSYMMFLLMPFAALLVAAAFKTPRRYYIDHLVFSVHFHCFAFLLLSVNLLISQLITSGWIAGATGAILFTYLFVALRTVYKEKVPQTLLKMAFVASTYTVVLGIAFVASVLISVFAA